MWLVSVRVQSGLRTPKAKLLAQRNLFAPGGQKAGVREGVRERIKEKGKGTGRGGRVYVIEGQRIASIERRQTWTIGKWRLYKGTR